MCGKISITKAGEFAEAARDPMKKALIFLAVCVAAAPMAVVVTLLLIPFWRWFEEKTGVESIGHSGPADWSFALVYFLILIASFGGWVLWQRKSSSRQ